MDRLMDDGPIPALFSDGLNPFTKSKNYKPLTPGVQGWAGQIGTLTLGDERGAVYDFEADVWEHRQNGVTHKWARRTHCFGHPPGTCNQRTSDETDIYCPKCFTAYCAEGVKERLQTKTELLLEDGIRAGLLPATWRFKSQVKLTEEQARGMVAVENDEQASVYIWGEPGRGKSTLAAEVAWSYHRRGRQVAIITMGDMRRCIDVPSYERHLCEVDCLVVDDVDKQLSAYTAGQLHAVLSARHDSRKRTIITSELQQAKVNQAIREMTNFVYGQSTLDRLHQPKHKCTTVELHGTNMRHGGTAR